MKSYRKKPVVIQAVQITSQMFDGPHPNPEHIPGVLYDPILRCVFIETLEGTHRGNIGDWIIRGVKGELYPCKSEIFSMTYEESDYDCQNRLESTR